MIRYRFVFLGDAGDLIATHEIDYDSDKAAIAGGHLINGSPPIGCCFHVWREDELIHWHYNVPHRSPGADKALAGA
jgi:hypothetical protein